MTATVTGPDGSTSEFALVAAPAVSPFTVTNKTDNEQGSMVGSLRLAIQDANQAPSISVTFDFGGAPASIDVATALPTIVAPVTIQGPPGPPGAFPS